MSEHMSIKGPCNFSHLPMDEEGGFAFCHYCKKVKQSLIIELHNGIVTDYIQCICPSCKKTIWVAELTNSYDEDMKLPKKWRTIGDGRVIIKDNKKCHICKKPTNHYDAIMIQYKLGSKKDKYFCSEKCVNEFEKTEEKVWEKLKYGKAKAMFDELGACAIEQGHSINMEGKIYLDIITIILFKKILKEELNITDKEFEEVNIYGNR